MDELINNILERSKLSNKFIIAIDGRGGSGKSTFAKKLKSEIKSSVLIELDSFQLESADIFNQENIKKNFEIDFENRKFNISEINKAISNSSSKIFVLEGCFSFKNLTGIQLNYLIWVDTDKEIAKDRLNNREMLERTEIPENKIRLCTDKYQEAEDRYINDFKPEKIANYIIKP